MTKGIYEYKSSYRDSTQDSLLVMEYLRKVHRYTVEDLTYDMEAQRSGIDLRVEGKSVEFKSDRKIHRTNNIAFEIVGNLTRAKIGCALSSEAEIVLYYDPISKICHKYNQKWLREAVATSSQSHWKSVLAATPIRDASAVEEGVRPTYTSVSLLIPLSFLQQDSRIGYTKYDLNKFITTSQQTWNKNQEPGSTLKLAS